MPYVYPIPAAAFRVDQYVTTQDEYTDDMFSPDGGFLRLSKHCTDGAHWWTGDFLDYRGIVSVYRQAGLTQISTAAGHRLHTRTWRKHYGDRTVAQLCRAFLTELHDHPTQGE